MCLKLVSGKMVSAVVSCSCEECVMPACESKNKDVYSSSMRASSPASSAELQLCSGKK